MITPHLWFDKQAKEAADFYVSLFPDSKVTHFSVMKDTPSGDCEIVGFEVAGQPFMAISAGPLFKLNPSISFILYFDPSKDPGARQGLDKAWAALSQGGEVLMPLEKYPFSEHYGWVQDRFGVSWQLILSGKDQGDRPFVVPSLMFTKDMAGRAAEAVDYYISIFPNSSAGRSQAYGPGREPDKAESLAFADFKLSGQCFAAMDSARVHKFVFNEAVSLLVPCHDQKEIDYYWSKLAADPAGGQCGWTKDRFGVSWQVWPSELGQMLSSGDPAKVKRVTQAFLQMKKFDLSKLRQAFQG